MTEAYFDSVRCIAFDFCGTLADLQPSSTEILGGWLGSRFGCRPEQERLAAALQQASAEMPYSSLTVTGERARRTYFVGFNARVLQLLGVDTAEGGELYAYFKQHERHWVMKRGAAAILKDLRAKGYRVVLASNFDAHLATLLSASGSAELFDAMFVSAELGVEKPELAFYRHVQASLGCAPDHIAMVGDDLGLDVLPARQAGLKPVHLRPNEFGGGEVRYVPEPGYLEISRLEDLLPLCADRVAGSGSHEVEPTRREDGRR
jgi:HAD superfamily hydrolase (TIGR01549 family)